MFFSAIMFFVLVSGSFFGAAIRKRRFEELLPVTCMSIVLILFIFGLFNALLYGVAFSVAVIIGSYVYSVYYIWRQKCIKETIALFFSPGFAIFSAVFVFFNVVDRGKLADSWDEFSHWMDCVKAMVYLDDFVTNPMSGSAFRTYPPGMASLQYFFQKLFLSLHQGASFNEWRMYLVYQLFIFSLMCPFFKKLSYKRPLEMAASVSFAILLPLFFYRAVYTTIYADPFVAILAGCGFSMILFYGKADKLYDVIVAMLCAVLVLAKDVGLFFACFIGMAYAADVLIRGSFMDRVRNKRRREGTILALKGFLPMIAAGSTKLLWMHEIKASGIVNTGAKIDLAAFTDKFFFHSDGTYLGTVIFKFKVAFFSQGVAFGPLQISYAALFSIAIVLLYVLYREYSRFLEVREKCSLAVTLSIVAGSMLLYIYGLGATYCYRFSEYEATNLASYGRYMNIVYLAVAVVVMFGWRAVLEQLPQKQMIRGNAVLLIVILLIVPQGSIRELLDHSRVAGSRTMRARYDKICSLIEEYCNGSDKIYFISQEDTGLDCWVTNFNIRPLRVDRHGFGGYSLGNPFDEGDLWTQKATLEDWKGWLTEEGYGYVALYRLNDYFLEAFSPLFEDPDDITEDTLYRFDREEGILRKCGGGSASDASGR